MISRALFQLQPRAAQKLLEMLPTVQIGISKLVKRVILSGFLDRVRDANNQTDLFERIRAEGPNLPPQTPLDRAPGS